jgi:hypothetical protein
VKLTHIRDSPKALEYEAGAYEVRGEMLRSFMFCLAPKDRQRPIKVADRGLEDHSRLFQPALHGLAIVERVGVKKHGLLIYSYY